VRGSLSLLRFQDRSTEFTRAARASFAARDRRKGFPNCPGNYADARPDAGLRHHGEAVCIRYRRPQRLTPVPASLRLPDLIVLH